MPELVVISRVGYYLSVYFWWLECLFFLFTTGIKTDYLALSMNEEVAILEEHWTMIGLYMFT